MSIYIIIHDFERRIYKSEVAALIFWAVNAPKLLMNLDLYVCLYVKVTFKSSESNGYFTHQFVAQKSMQKSLLRHQAHSSK